MTISMHAASVPLFRQLFGSLGAVLRKGEAMCAARGTDPQALFAARLAPDMLPLSRQVQIASDTAKNAVARLAGVEAPRFADDETDFAQLHDRIARTLAFIDGVPAERVDGSEERPIAVPAGRAMTLHMNGLDYLTRWVIPHFTFHVTTAYDILRHNGVEIGKRDFIGDIPARVENHPAA